MITDVTSWYRKVESSCTKRSSRVVENILPKLIRVYCGKSDLLCNYKNCPKKNGK
nr:MAG TPA: hypothetical protein [Caudoviricetes sp.]